MVTDWQPARRTPATSAAAMLRTALSRAVYFAVCLCLHWLPGSAGSSSSLTILPLAWPRPFSRCGLWGCGQDHTWSPGAGFASISVTDSLGPRTLGLSFPICHITRWTVWQMFFGSKRVSSNDVQCQSPEYKADSSGGLVTPGSRGLLLWPYCCHWKLSSLRLGVPSGPPLASSAGRKATGCVVCCVLTQRTPTLPRPGLGPAHMHGLLWPLSSLGEAVYTWSPLALAYRSPLRERGDSVVTPLPPLLA